MIEIVPGVSVFIKDIKKVGYNKAHLRFEAHLLNGEIWAISKKVFRMLALDYKVKHRKSKFLKEE